ncbi:general odorant-binding protein 67-like [Armigeres subalbatus]|uniref:general odorant-binding protein 67-like n=1 Tax=Armigeres subalbatus TaxID=124917 RepID=UPI002ED47E01
MATSAVSTLVVILLLIRSSTAQPKPDDTSCIEGNQKKILDCCRMPLLVSQGVVARCMMENPMTLAVPGVQRMEGCCIAQCLLTTLNAFSNNTIDKEAAKRAFAQSLSLDAYFIPLINAVVDECYNLVNNNAAYKAVPVAPKPGRKACSFAPEGFLNCVKTKLFQLCPVAVWTKNPACDRLKQKLAFGCSFDSLMG